MSEGLLLILAGLICTRPSKKIDKIESKKKEKKRDSKLHLQKKKETEKETVNQKSINDEYKQFMDNNK